MILVYRSLLVERRNLCRKINLVLKAAETKNWVNTKRELI